MNKKTLFVFISFVGLLSMAAISFAASNLNLSKSNVNRVLPEESVLVSATVNISSNETQTIYTTPTSGDFILTTFCASAVQNGSMSLAAEGFGSIAQTTDNNLCYAFNPGLVMPRESAITCSSAVARIAARLSASNLYFCTISGYFIGDRQSPG